MQITIDLGKIYTPYAMAQLINGWFATNGIGKRISPQMLYSYDQMGMLTGRSDRQLTGAEVITWFENYRIRNARRLA